MTIDLIVYGILSLLVVVLLANSLRLHLKVRRISAKLLQDSLDKAIVINGLTKKLEELSSKDVEKTDGFLKFISESRDWAFQYIEDVQQALNTFKEKVEPKLKYAAKYGALSEKTPQLTILEEITLAYMDLKKVMPEDEVEPKDKK